MYKLTRPDGFDFYSGKINYRDAIGSTIWVSDFDPPEKGACGRGLHASKNPNDCFVGAKIPCAAFLVEGKKLIAYDNHKSRYRGLKVIEEITDLDALFGWRYSKVVNPIHPFKIDPPAVGEAQVRLLKEWDSVRASVWDSVGDSVGDSVRASVWAYVGNLFPNITDWKYAPKTEGYPFQPCIDLLTQGLVPSYDKRIWRLHGGPKGNVLFELND